MKYDKISLDTLFSIWVFIWAFVYYLTITFQLHSPIPLEYWNPAASLILAFSYQILTVFAALMITPSENLAKVLTIITLVIIVFKAGPLYLIWTNDIPWINSVISGTALFCVYYAYIYSKGLTVEKLYKTLTGIIVRDETAERIVAF